MEHRSEQVVEGGVGDLFNKYFRIDSRLLWWWWWWWKWSAPVDHGGEIGPCGSGGVGGTPVGGTSNVTVGGTNKGGGGGGGWWTPFRINRIRWFLVEKEL